MGKVSNDGNQQWHFDFKDWRDAFDTFYRWKKKDSAFCLVVSTNSYTSGYWIERNAKTDKETRVYRSVKAVKELESRVTAARDKTVSVSLGGVIL